MSKELTSAVPLTDEPIEDLDPGATTDTPADNASAEAAAPADADADAEALRAMLADEDAGDAAPQGSIPKPRFDEVNERRKAAEQEAAHWREVATNLSQTRGAGADTAATTATAESPRDFDAELKTLFDRYENGDLEEAEFRKEERKLIREQVKAETLKELAPTVQELQAERQRVAQERLTAEMNAEAAKAYAKYPFLNHASDDKNDEAIAAVMKERDELINSGVSPVKALRLAVASVAPEYVEGAKPTTDDTRVADELAQRRRAEARKAAGEAANAQPPTLATVGNGTAAQGAQRLSASVKDHEKWAKVPEAQREKAFTA